MVGDSFIKRFKTFQYTYIMSSIWVFLISSSILVASISLDLLELTSPGYEPPSSLNDLSTDGWYVVISGIIFYTIFLIFLRWLMYFNLKPAGNEAASLWKYRRNISLYYGTLGSAGFIINLLLCGLLGNIFSIFLFIFWPAVFFWSLRWIRKDNKKYNIDWFSFSSALKLHEEIHKENVDESKNRNK